MESVCPRGGVAPSSGGRWSLYDEKYGLNGKGVFNAMAPQSWLQDLRDDRAGRSANFDAVFDWAKRQLSKIPLAPDRGAGDFPMFDQCQVEPKEVARQFWAFLGPIVANDACKTSTLKNVARHNGIEAWR